MQVCEAATRAAGEILREKLGKVAFQEKDRADLVTEADISAQECIYALVKKSFPDHEFLGEEAPGTSAESYQITGDGKFCWIVDPLDGTTNFVHGVPFFSVSFFPSICYPITPLSKGKTYDR